MPNFSPPFNPVGLYNPCYMSNMYGASWSAAWNTSIYGSPQQAGADVLSNCVGYTQGRMLFAYNEVTGYDPAQTGTHPFTMFNANAGDWYQIAISNGFTVQSEPREGSVLVTADHVAFVELYDDQTDQWWISESGYNADPYLYQTSLYKDELGRWCSAYSFPSKLIKGFILVPGLTPGPGPGPTPAKKSKWIYYLKNWNNEL